MSNWITDWGANAITTALLVLDTFPMLDVVSHKPYKPTKWGVIAHTHNGGPYYLKTTTTDDPPRIAGIVNSNSCSSCHDHEMNVPTPDKKIMVESNITPCNDTEYRI